MTFVLDDESKIGIPGKVECQLYLKYAGDVDHIRWEST
jgi:hypothetical protein